VRLVDRELREIGWATVAAVGEAPDVVRSGPSLFVRLPREAGPRDVTSYRMAYAADAETGPLAATAAPGHASTRRSAILTVAPASGRPEAFPVDMLRTERAVPLQEADARTIEAYGLHEVGRRALADLIDEETGRARAVRLETFWRTDTGLPTPDLRRWASYGWRVLECRWIDADGTWAIATYAEPDGRVA
jgi:hypothetical protein